MTSNTLIIAEAGVNHNGEMKIAKSLIDAAADAGADLIKFQSFIANRIVARSAPKAGYQRDASCEDESQLDLLRRLELSPDMHAELISYCAKRGIGFFSSGFDIESVRYLDSLGAARFKIPSGEITNLPYLRFIGALGKPLILSTGMASLGEIEDALDVLEAAGSSRREITVLHCNTQYPTPIKDVNLLAMTRIRDAFGVSVGYSDHTLGIEVPIAAVALGASVIEKHLTLDRSLPGPDHGASLEPADFSAMVRAIRNIEKAMGDGIKRPSQGEIENAVAARKSLVAEKSIKAGERFSSENLTVKRPGIGISPMLWDEYMGRTSNRDYKKDELIEL